MVEQTDCGDLASMILETVFMCLLVLSKIEGVIRQHGKYRHSRADPDAASQWLRHVVLLVRR